MIKRMALIGFTANALERIAEISKALTPETELRIYRKDDDLKSFVGEAFRDCDAILFVSAAGIAVRSIAPYIQSKDRDPAVIVMDELGENIVPILSGHIGGANDLAFEIAEITGATPVITTGTDVNRKFAVDVWAVKNGFVIDDISKIKMISSAVIHGEPVGLYVENPDAEIIGEIPPELTLVRDGDGVPEKGIYVGVRTDVSPFKETFRVFPRSLVIGSGCRRDKDPEVFCRTLRYIMSDCGLTMKAVAALATIDIKKDEKCMKVFCEEEGIDMITFTAEELMEEKGDFSHSAFVEKMTGADNVSERAAFRAVRMMSGKAPQKHLAKTALNEITLAVFEKEWEIRFDV
ncbi:MAG: cobalamin biosynthesis protein [Firmicutes bacterium]|nr:cobalamin biosynthesis protein [Bacillota bacterium]